MTMPKGDHELNKEALTSVGSAVLVAKERVPLYLPYPS